MTKDLVGINRVLLSVTDKSGVAEFARGIREIVPAAEIISSGGTAKVLEQNGISYTPLSEFTGFPECLGGRLKTLHPLIAGGILMRRGKDDEEAMRLGIQPIDLVVCNLYDFAKSSSDESQTFCDQMESMDIGGSTLIRSACKNYTSTTVIVDPSDYPLLLHDMKKHKGMVSLKFREQAAVKAINASANYEALLAKVITKKLADEQTDRPHLRQGKQLRYGENPDQKAWVYSFEHQQGIANSKVIAGNELSYNNYEDATVAYNAAQELLDLSAKYGVAIIKHGSLCAYATGESLKQAFDLAWEGDSKSAYGSVIGITATATAELIDILKSKFIELIIAPEFEQTFIDWAKKNKPKLKLLTVPNRCKNTLQYKNISGGLLVQTRKENLFSSSLKELFKPCEAPSEKLVGVVTNLLPGPEMIGLYAFGIAAVNYAKSNAVAIVREPVPGAYQLIGMGAGQPNRVDSLQRLAIPKAIENLQNEHHFDPDYNPKQALEKCVIASDGFFPFDDSIRYAAKSGLKNCIQPGGSKRDKDVIDAANEMGVCMVFTGQRYFCH